MTALRPDGRQPDQMRQVRITPGYLAHAEGSALIELGQTIVLCAVTTEDRLPPFLRGSGSGWVTAEYGMLPRSTLTRSPREAALGRVGARTHEIQRLIGRSLRAVTKLDLLGERTLTLDCDVLQADGGTRTASITGGCVALADACQWLAAKTGIATPFGKLVGAVSVGIVAGEPRLDLNYLEDKGAGVDANLVMIEPDQFVEVQGTGESSTFSRAELDAILELGKAGIERLFTFQRQALGW